MKSSELSREQMIIMIGRLRGLAYSLKYDVEDGLPPESRFVSNEEFTQIIDETSFDVDEF